MPCKTRKACKCGYADLGYIVLKNGGKESMKKRRRLKKGLAIVLTAAMVVGLLPGVGTLQVSATESDENTVNTVSSNEAMTLEQTDGQATDKLITAWEWIDEEEILDEETGNLALPGANEQKPAYFDDVTAFLPTQIQATVVNAEDTDAESGEEIINLGDWNCEDYPEEGAYSGSYIFTATLPEGYVLSEKAKALAVTVELGGAQTYESAEGITVGAFTVTGGENVGYEFNEEERVLRIWSGDTPITIANTDQTQATTVRIEVWNGENITLAGVNIDVSSLDNTAAFKIIEGCENAKIILADNSENTLISGPYCAGLQMSTEYQELTIQGGTNGTGKLTATGGSGGAGIGGGNGGTGSKITITGGTVTATGGMDGAGIGGGGNGGTGSNITISGGTVTATGGSHGAGIGGGNGGTGSKITIRGGTVTATSWYGAGIGGGCDSSGSDITIEEGGIVTATSSLYGAGIGGGGNGGTGSDITIKDGIVTATSSLEGAGIGGGGGGTGSSITIEGGIVTATSDADGAGIGGGSYGTGSKITIRGGTVTATSTNNGAGIGGGNGGTGSNITISGGIVTATGGTNYWNSEIFGGAGIGGGSNGTGSSITISGGSVKAVAGTNANDIGGGSGQSAVTPTNDGTTPVYLLTIENPDSKEVLIDGKSYKPVNHKAVDENDTKLYAYLPATTVTEPNVVQVGTETTKYFYENSEWHIVVPEVTTRDAAKEALQIAILDRKGNIKFMLTGDALNGITADNVGEQGTALYTEALKHITAGEAGSNAKLGDYLAKAVAGYSLQASYTTDESGLLSVTYSYQVTYYTDKAQEDTVDSRLSEIYTSLQLSDSTLTDAQKIWKIYDWITNNVTYDYENLNDDNNKTKYTAYGALSDGKAVCQGFAGLFYRMCMDNGIDCRIVTGTADNGQSNGAHAWNIVRVGEAYYYVDATWDCKVLADAANSRHAKPGTLYYFLRSSLESHTESESETEKVTSGYTIAAASLTGIQIEVPGDVTKDTISSSVVLKDLCGTALTEEQLAWYQITVTNDTTDTCKWSVTVIPSAVGLDSIVLAEETVYTHGEADENGCCKICKEIIDAYKHLQALITVVNAITQENYSDASYQTLQDALAKAKALTNESIAEELTAAYEALDAAKNGLKTATVTVTTSSNPANSGILTGGGKYAVGETITLTAKAVSGYKFLGWYLGDAANAESTNTTYEIIVTESTAEELNYIAKYEANENKKLSVTVGNGTVAYSYQNGTQTGIWSNSFTDNEFAKGTYFTVTAKPIEGYTFLYWINSAGRVLTESPTYSFYLGDDLKLEACYKTAVENQHYVIFKDMNGKVLWSGDVEMNQTDDAGATYYGTVALPDHGTFVGYTFKQWKDASGKVISIDGKTGTVKITEDIVIYAEYEAVTGLTLTVNDVKQNTTYAYASKVTVTADESKGGKYFSGWYIGEKLVSDSREYTFYITEDTSLTAKYEGESVIVQQPIVNMTMSKRTPLDNGKQTLVMNVTWSVPEGYTFVEGGLVRSLVDEYSEKLTLSDVDGTNVKKNVSKLTAGEGTYACTLTLGTASVSKNVYAVGYITYKNDATGEVMTIYTDKFTSTAFSSENVN